MFRVRQFLRCGQLGVLISQGGEYFYLDLGTMLRTHHGQAWETAVAAQALLFIGKKCHFPVLINVTLGSFYNVLRLVKKGQWEKISQVWNSRNEGAQKWGETKILNKLNFSNLPEKVKISLVWILGTSALFALLIQTISHRIKNKWKVRKEKKKKPEP